MKKEHIEELNRAIQALGYAEGTKVKCHPVAFGRYEISCNGALVGIYDIKRKTFVD